MKFIQLKDGHIVKCSQCCEQHTITGLVGNNLGWSDKDGWSGNGYDARKVNESLEIDARCPRCASFFDGLTRAQLEALDWLAYTNQSKYYSSDAVTAVHRAFIELLSKQQQEVFQQIEISRKMV